MIPSILVLATFGFRLGSEEACLRWERAEKLAAELNGSQALGITKRQRIVVVAS